MGSLRWVWLWWGAGTLLATNAVLLRLAASRSYLGRASAGGRSPLGILVLFPSAAAATAIVVGSAADPFPWVGVALFVPIFAFSEYRRRRLAGVPPEELAPTVRRWRDEVPGLGELVRHPLRSTNANLRFFAQQNAARREDKAWERDRGLR